jgi:hypothetical protein
MQYAGQLLALCNVLALRWLQHNKHPALPVPPAAVLLAMPALQYCSHWADLLPVDTPMPGDETRSFMQVVYTTNAQPLTPRQPSLFWALVFTRVQTRALTCQ